MEKVCRLVAFIFPDICKTKLCIEGHRHGIAVNSILLNILTSGKYREFEITMELSCHLNTAATIVISQVSQLRKENSVGLVSALQLVSNQNKTNPNRKKNRIAESRFAKKISNDRKLL